MTDKQIDTIARACHEANRAWCLYHDDTSQVAYDDAPENIKESARSGVAMALTATPEEQHEAWSMFKRRDGWVYGDVKDSVAKTHPCLVPYADLPPEQKKKDAIYIGVVRAFHAALTE